MNTYEAKVERFARLYEDAQLARLAHDHPGLERNEHYRVKVTHRQKYTFVDFGGSGHYAIERSTGDIYGIKGYGRIHRGHFYGNLDSIESWNWSGYYAVRQPVEA